MYIPTSWALCNGQNGTPDLRGRFIIGYDGDKTDYNQIGKTGGAEQVALTEAQMPWHTHTGIAGHDGEHTHLVHSIGDRYLDNAPQARAVSSNSDFTAGPGRGYDIDIMPSGGHSHTVYLSHEGSNQPHENRPPYYVLAYIIKL